MNPRDTDGIRQYYDTTDTSELIEKAGTIDLGVHTGPDAMSAFTVRLPTNVLNTVRSEAKKRGVTTGAVLRQFVEEGVAGLAEEDAVIPVSQLRSLIATAKTAPAPRAAGTNG